MANSLNLTSINNVTTVAQKDTASTFIYELQDENNLPIRTIDTRHTDGALATINLTRNGTVSYQTTSRVFDGRIEFNINRTLDPGTYVVEVHLSVEGFTYIFPSDLGVKIIVTKVVG